METDVMTLPEVARLLRLADKTAYRLAAEGKLPGFKIGGSWRFRRADIEAWIDARKSEASGDPAKHQGRPPAKDTAAAKKGQRR